MDTARQMEMEAFASGNFPEVVLALRRMDAEKSRCNPEIKNDIDSEKNIDYVLEEVG